MRNKLKTFRVKFSDDSVEEYFSDGMVEKLADENRLVISVAPINQEAGQ